jgi:S1-C subfamily serine protease
MSISENENENENENATYVVNNYDAVNAHVDELVHRNRLITTLGLEKIALLRSRKLFFLFVGIGLFIFLLACAYWLFQKSFVSSNNVQPTGTTIVTVPDKNLSKIIEMPVYIEKPVYIPVEIPVESGVVTDFSIFRTVSVNKDGFSEVVTGLGFENSKSPSPSNQWCYTSFPKSGSSSIRIELGAKTGTGMTQWSKLKASQAKEVGVKLDDLESVKQLCKFMEKNQAEVEEAIGMDPPSNSSKSGTGFVVNDNGHVLTNEHVVSQCGKIFFKIHNVNYPVDLVWQSAEKDLAILHSTNLVTPSYAIFSEQTRAGEDVVALGFPLGDVLGDELKVTKGNISAMVGYKSDPAYFQFTAPIQPGNSGGPLLNEFGYVVGINTAALVGEGFQNINFAIKGTVGQQALGSNRVEFHTAPVGDASSTLSSVEIVESGGDYTGQVICSG